MHVPPAGRLSRNPYFWLVICSLLTLAVVYLHGLLPPRVLVIYPSEQEIEAYIYSDGNDGGNSRAIWLDQDNMSWRCEIASGAQYPYCGAHIYLAGEGTGVDMSLFRSLIVHLDYQGPDGRLRVYLRNHEEGFSDPDRLETDKFNNASIAVEHFSEPLAIGFDEFFVAEWWINEYDIPRDRIAPNFDAVSAFGIDLAYPANVGEHNFNLNRLEFVGIWVSAERWYLSVLLFWVLAIIAWGAINLVRLNRRVSRERTRRYHLAGQNMALQRESSKYKELSRTDALTGLLNRHGLSGYIERYFGDDDKLPDISLAIADLDQFKRINDNLGHDAGDLVLTKLAGVIRDNVRHADLACRWGGEEFVLLLPNTSGDEAHATAEKLRGVIANTRFDDHPDIHMTISIGVGSRNAGEAFHQLFSRADVALYKAKAQGRNRTVLAS